MVGDVAPMTAYRIPANVAVQKVADEMVILDLDSGRYYGLDEVGARIVEILQEHGTTEAVLAALEAEYDASRETLQADLKTLLKRLEENGLVQRGA